MITVAVSPGKPVASRRQGGSNRQNPDGAPHRGGEPIDYDPPAIPGDGPGPVRKRTHVNLADPQRILPRGMGLARCATPCVCRRAAGQAPTCMRPGSSART